jgi:hypothetical protein
MMELRYWPRSRIPTQDQHSILQHLRLRRETLFVACVSSGLVADMLIRKLQLRQTLNFPVPRILDYSPSTLNPVGVEYILEEKARGRPLGNIWQTWPIESQRKIVTQIVDLEAKLASLSFQKHGCLYYKTDLTDRGDAAQSVEVTASCDGGSVELDFALLDKFAIGPLTQAVLWDDERATMPLDRGPCKSELLFQTSILLILEGSNAIDYMMAIGTNEIQWAERYARPHMNYFRTGDASELPQEYLSLWKRYLSLVPHLASSLPRELQSKTLSHHDLHLDNIFVDPDIKIITHIIDWQSTAVSELF